ncbi:uncharacterized protein avpi1 isoform X2 [Echeneis naucrates]|uniref:uncharacterized protein avpi1 isoform X2 n=1 Tax=Echeneis naucrates TaxID=173247 RepID=UPI00111331EE|nr:uncharacterized protein LOC115047279 isoform X2 [Echeneis naucrates]
MDYSLIIPPPPWLQAPLTHQSEVGRLSIKAIHPINMAEAPASTSTEDGLSVQWKFTNRQCRKSGCSNIFSGVNLHQLHRLFRTAGDRDAEHRAKLVWQGMDADMEGAEEKGEGEAEERQAEAGLAQAMVGLRVRTRNKAGIRVEGHRDHKWLRASGYLRIEEPLSSYTVEDEDNQVPGLGEFLLPTEEDIPENPNPFKSSSWRWGAARLDSAKDSERYLHRILH